MLLVRSYRTFAPLPVKQAVCFCGTILTIARTGRYPASLVFRKPGLSSNSISRTRNRFAYFLPSGLYGNRQPDRYAIRKILLVWQLQAGLLLA
jgi:hypothetical protein